MILTSSTGISFKLNITGYQFPQMETEYYDANWLLVQTHVTHPKGDWTSTDACLLTHEVTKLANWLESIHHGKSIQPGMSFMEPHLVFRLGLDENNNDALRIDFQLAARPPWAEERHAVNDEEHWVEFPLAENDLAAAARQLREQLKKFPQRAGE
ncbi:MAG: hypothetical protein RBT34_12630 [Anaerolineaceae bacterium]|jgi:hypothetical protein|nr:hypothetical protein [Anaerolineaceae bacterium]